MSGSADVEAEDRQAATLLVQVAHRAGVTQIVYLGGQGDDDDPKLSLTCGVATKSARF